MSDKITLELNSPITEEQWDIISDVDFDHTDEITFYTKHGKEVTFVKSEGRLRPCPFCGGTPILNDMRPTYNEFYISCEKCGIEQHLYKSKAAAINAWNRRKA